MVEGQNIWVDLVNDDQTIYATAKMPEDYREGVRKASDSSRGYALRLTSDDGRTMWVGLCFHDRNHAFEFYAQFDRFHEQREMERNPGLYS